MRLSLLFEWLDRHPAAFWLGATAGTVALAVGVVAAFRPVASSPGRRVALAFPTLSLLFILAWRWPGLFNAAEYNPDESQFLAGALTLTHDPVFWRSVDGTTSGPLNFYALLPLHALGLPLDYFSARLTALLLSWGTLLALHRLFRAATGPGPAQLAVLPAALFFAWATDADFVHYSSELLPLALLALALTWSRCRPLASAFVTGLLPWAKLQAVPLGLVAGLWLLLDAWLDAPPSTQRPPWRRWAALVACAALPTVASLGGLAACGQLAAFYERYLNANLVYVQEGMSAGEALRGIWDSAGVSQHLPFWILGTGTLLVAAGAAYAASRRRPARHFWLGLALLITAGLSVVVPARPSLHYTLLLVVPATLATGRALADFWPAARPRTALLAVLGASAVLLLGARLTRGTPGMIGQLAHHWRHPYTPLGSVLRHWRTPGCRLTVWGWLTSPHVETGLPQGTRDALTVWPYSQPHAREYFQQAYLADIQASRPEIFVDSVPLRILGPGELATLLHESIPALATFIRANYVLAADIPPARVYVRRDFLAAHPLDAGELKRRLALGRLEFGGAVTPDSVRPAPATFTALDHTSVQMIEPPTQVEWRLMGDQRVAELQFGMHPRAWQEGRTNGAELIATLRPPGEPEIELYRRTLNPVDQAADRRLVKVELPLPPFPAGSTLAIRTAPGPHGDAAWDWVYLRSLRLLRFPGYLPVQFPGFNRAPDTVQGRHAALIEQPGGERYLALQPTARLGFVLEGAERRLEFDYGFERGAYLTGQTDGAIFRVERRLAAGGTEVLWEKALRPLAVEADRGRQHAVVPLPAGRAGDELVVNIDPGGNDSWDWTYLANLQLH